MHATEVCIVTGQRLEIGEITVNFLKVVRLLCRLQSAQTRFGAHPSFYAMGIGVAFSGDVGMKLTTRLHLLPNLIVIGAKPPLLWAGSRYSDSLRAGRSGDLIPVETRCSALVQTGPGAHPASYTINTGSFPRVRRPERGVEQHPYISPGLKKEYSTSGP